MFLSLSLLAAIPNAADFPLPRSALINNGRFARPFAVLLLIQYTVVAR